MNNITPSMLLTVLDSPIAYHRIYATITGSVTSAVMLSQAMYWTPRTSDPHNWFYKTADDWQKETGLSRREQETARRILKNLQILEEEKHGLPCKLFFRINLEVLYSLIVDSANQDSTQRENKYGGKRQTAMYFSAIQDVTKETNNLYTKITPENTAEIKSGKSFDLHLVKNLENLALESTSKDQDPTPLNPPAPPSRNYAEEMSDRFRDGGNKSKQVKAWQENDLFLRFIHKDLAQKSEYYKNQPYESAKHYIGKSKLSSPDMVLRYEELSDRYQDFLESQQRSNHQQQETTVETIPVSTMPTTTAKEFAAKLARKAS